MQLIYHWAFAVAPALCPRAPSTLKSGWARAPPGYMPYGASASGTWWHDRSSADVMSILSPF